MELKLLAKLVLNRIPAALRTVAIALPLLANWTPVLAATLPTVSASNIAVSCGFGAACTFIVGDAVAVVWDNSPTGDNNSGITAVTIDFTEFGGGPVAANDNGDGTWSALMPVYPGNIDATGLNVSVAATNAIGTTTTTGTNNASLDNILPTVTDANIAISGASGTNGTYIAGDTVTVSWDDTASGDNNSDTFDVAANFAQFGGGPQPAMNNAGIWTSSYTIPAGSSGGSNLNVAVAAMDDAGNISDATDSSNATVDATVPSVANVTSSTANGTYAAGDVISIQVQFSETVNVTGTPQLTLETGATDEAVSYSGGSGSATLTFNYTVQPGDASSDLDYVGTNSLTLNGGAIKDVSGNPANLALASPGASGSLGANKALVIDTTAGTPPTAMGDSAATDEDSSVPINVLANDSASSGSLNAASVLISVAPGHGTASLNTATGVITYTPDANYNGADSFVYTVEDTLGSTSNQATVSLTINSVNDTPVAVGDVASTAQDTALTIDVAANDTDVDSGDSADPTTLALASNPAHGSAVIQAGTISYTPAAGFSGTDAFTYTIDDLNGGVSGTARVLINVGGTNQAPTTAPDSQAGNEDSVITTDVLANDSDADGTLDPSTVRVVAGPAHGMVSVDTATGQVSYTPSANFNGSDSFSYVVQDDGGATSNASAVTVSVGAVADAPVASSDTVVVQGQGTYTINVLGNDSDADGDIDPTSVTIITPPSGAVGGKRLKAVSTSQGNVSVDTTNGTVIYTPASGFSGTDTFQYTVDDGSGLASNIATVTITDSPANNPPLANDDSAGTPEDMAVSVALLDNDGDVDGSLNVAGVSILSSPAHGSVVVDSGTGSATYTPSLDFNGADSFTYTVTDDGGATSNIATVNLLVRPVNDAPSAVNDSVTTREDTAITVDVLANDVDVDDGDSLDPATLTIIDTPALGSASVQSGMIRYVPRRNFYGTESFTYTIDDQNGKASAAGTVSVHVTAVNDSPTISGSPATAVDEHSGYSFTPTATDVDHDSLTFSIANLPQWASFSSTTGALTGTPTSADIGKTTGIVISVSDGSASASLPAFDITVIDVNDAPTISGAPDQSVDERSSYSFTPTAGDPDVGDTLTFSIDNKPAWATFDAASGELHGTPMSADVGTTSGIVIHVSDGQISASLPAFTLEVVNINDPPTISGVPPTSVLQNAAYSFTPEAVDPDEEDTLTFSIANKPDWAFFDSTNGRLSGVPGRGDIGVISEVVISVSDGIAGAVALPAFSITVRGDFDGDGLADSEDSDDDNDGMSDECELAAGLDPFDPSDASGDLDGDGRSNLTECTEGTDVTQPDGAPTITAPEDITVNAMGLFTKVDLGVATAFDAAGTQLPVTSDSSGFFSPGSHTVTWSAQNSAGITGTDTQVVKVIPLVEFSKNQNTAEGGTITIKALLNGPALTYPVTVPYTVGGTASTDGSDHDLADGVITIDSPALSGSVTAHIVDDGTGEGRETIVVTMGSPTNAVAGAHNTHTVGIFEENVAPDVVLEAKQGAGATRIVSQDGGLVTVTAKVTDPNTEDSHTYDWSQTDNALVDTDADDTTFTFDPSGLSPGFYKLRVEVSDGDKVDKDRLKIRVEAALPTLDEATDSDGDGTSDKDEGVGDNDDDGIPDFLDSANLARNVVQERQAQSNSFLIEAEPGLSLNLGSTSFQAQGNSAHLSEDDVTMHANDGRGAQSDENYEYNGGLFDFNVEELPVAGQSVAIVVAQFRPIPANAVYRKLLASGWQEFVVNDNNSVASALGTEGFCPPPGDVAYVDGLTEGHWCVQLTIEDGGPNDGDGEANQAVDDPGGVAVRVRRSGGGSGALLGSLWLLLLAGLMHRASRRRRASELWSRQDR